MYLRAASPTWCLEKALLLKSWSLANDILPDRADALDASEFGDGEVQKDFL